MDSLALPPPKLECPPLPSTFPCFQPLRDALGFCRAALSTGHASYSNLTFPATKTVCDGETKRVYLRGKTHSLSSMFSGSYKQKGSACPLSSSLPPCSEWVYLLAPSQTSRISSSDPFSLNFAATSTWSLQTVLTVWPRLDGFVSFSWSGSLPQQRSAGWLWSFCMPGKLHLWHRWDVRHL